jgi:hypothetical protein
VGAEFGPAVGVFPDCVMGTLARIFMWVDRRETHNRKPYTKSIQPAMLETSYSPSDLCLEVLCTLPSSVRSTGRVIRVGVGNRLCRLKWILAQEYRTKQVTRTDILNMRSVSEALFASTPTQSSESA